MLDDFSNSYDVTSDQYVRGPHILEIYSTVWKGMKENQECTNGDYF